MKNRYPLFALLATLAAACNVQMAITDDRSPLPDGCVYEPHDSSDTGEGGSWTGHAVDCASELQTAVARCADGEEPYALAHCFPHPHPWFPGEWCCPVSVWPRDPNGDRVPVTPADAGTDASMCVSCSGTLTGGATYADVCADDQAAYNTLATCAVQQCGTACLSWMTGDPAGESCTPCLSANCAQAFAACQ